LIKEASASFLFLERERFAYGTGCALRESRIATLLESEIGLCPSGK
jgi:hypothetical protein